MKPIEQTSIDKAKEVAQRLKTDRIHVTSDDITTSISAMQTILEAHPDKNIKDETQAVLKELHDLRENDHD